MTLVADIILQPIGIIHSPFTDPAETPIQSMRSTAPGWVEVFPQYAAGLQDIEGFSHLYLIYQFHRCQRTELLVEPFLDDRQHGIFAVRHPNRPNHLGLSVVELLGVRSNILDIRAVDVLDGTPLLDIKPFVPAFDDRPDARSGWYATRSKP
jgi:tRNA-Thr(GGU) m(6)t(6)A37 methyltransferase TsaA